MTKEHHNTDGGYTKRKRKLCLSQLSPDNQYGEIQSSKYQVSKVKSSKLISCQTKCSVPDCSDFENNVGVIDDYPDQSKPSPGIQSVPCKRQGSVSTIVSNRSDCPVNLRRSKRTLKPNVRLAPFPNVFGRLRERTLKEPSRRPKIRKGKYKRKQIIETNIDPLCTFDVHEHHLGVMGMICPHCGAAFFKEETTNGKYTTCCKNGKVKLPPLEPIPQLFQDLFGSRTTESRNFISHARDYNNALSLASISVSVRDFGRNRSAPPCFSINGQIHHHGIPLYNYQETKPRFAQLFFVNPSEALRIRHGHERGKVLDKSILEKLDYYLRVNNVLVGGYRMLDEYYKQETRRFGKEPSNLALLFYDGGLKKESSSIDLLDVHDVNHCLDHIRRDTLSIPVANEVAAVFTHSDGEPRLNNRSLVIYPRGKLPSNLSRFSDLCDPMCYSLFFPSGLERGWNFQLSKIERITCSKFYCYRLQYRHNDFNILLRGGLLSSQFMVDSYVKSEECELSWIRRNQAKLRAETYAILFIRRQK